MKILRLFLALAILGANFSLPVAAQTPQQRQLQQQRYQQQQLQQQQYQRQQQLQARRQRLQQLQTRQRQLQQQQQQLRYKQQQLQQQRQTAARKTTADANANKKLAAGRTNAVRRKTIPNNSQEAQAGTRVGRSRALAVPKSTNLVSGSGPKTPIPAVRSPQVLQAKASLRTNQLSALRASLQTKLQARGPTASSLNDVRGGEQRPKAGGGSGDCDKKPEDCGPPRRTSIQGPQRPPDTKISTKKDEPEEKKQPAANDNVVHAAASRSGSNSAIKTGGSGPSSGGGRSGGPPSDRGSGGNGASGGGGRNGSGSPKGGSGNSNGGSGGGPTHANDNSPGPLRHAALKFGTHVPDNVVVDRGWGNKAKIEEVVAHPEQKIATRDTRRNGPNEAPNNEPATAYLGKDGHYVVVRDRDGDVVAISDKNDPNWRWPDWHPNHR